MWKYSFDEIKLKNGTIPKRFNDFISSTFSVNLWDSFKDVYGIRTGGNVLFVAEPKDQKSPWFCFSLKMENKKIADGMDFTHTWGLDLVWESSKEDLEKFIDNDVKYYCPFNTWYATEVKKPITDVTNTLLND